MDPGLLTLGALAVGATLLPKFFKSRKEGFEPVPAQGYPETVQENQELYNRLTLSSDPRSEVSRVLGLPESQQNAYKKALDAATATVSVNYDSTGQLNVNQGETENPVLLPSDASLLARAAYCSNKPIDGNMFSDAQFARDCGVCLTGGRTHDNKQFTGQKGMYIHPERKQELLANKQQSGALYTNGKPEYGYCDGATAGVGSKYSFALDKPEMDLLQNRLNCQNSRTLDGNCATCLSDSSYTYVGKQGRTLDTITFKVYGVNAVVDANLGGTKPDFKYPEKMTTFVSAPRGAASFSLILNEGAFLLFNVAGWAGLSGAFLTLTNPYVEAEFWGLIEFKNSTGGIERIALDRLLLKDEATGRVPKYSKDFVAIDGVYCRKMLKPSGQQFAMLSGQLPFLLVNNAPFTGVDCKGSLLQTLGSSVEKFGGDPCYKPSSQGPGSWTDACLRDRIQTLGCSANGNLYKDPSPLRNLTMTQIIQTVQENASKQYSENESSMKCNGRNISTPCDPFLNYEPGETPELSDQCISFLYFNQGADKPHIGPTYTGPVDSFSSKDANGKKIVCLPNAKMDPSRGDQFYLRILKEIYRKGWATNGSSPGLDAVKKFMDYQFNRAVNTSLNANAFEWQGGRKDNIELCFTSLANIPESILPDAKLPNARYCRVRFPPPGRNECIQISQVAVFDNRDTNVAFGKPTSSSGPLGSDCGPERAVDGARQARGHPYEFHSLCKAGDFWMVDFTKTFPIKRVEYYNRADCCAQRAVGMVIELLNDAQQVVWTQTLDGSLTQVFYTFTKNFNV